MAISNISSSLSIQDMQSVTSPSVSQTPATDASGAASGVSVDISKPGQLLGQLQSLAQSNPDEFKSVTADIAQQLKDAASQTSGAQADALNKIADRFTAASQSGNASDLTPNAGKAHGHHGGHHHRAHGSGGAGSAPMGQGDPVGQQVQSIISSALTAASSSSSTSTTASS